MNLFAVSLKQLIDLLAVLLLVSLLNTEIFAATEVPRDETLVSPAITGDEIEQALEDTLHTINEIGRFIQDIGILFEEDPLAALLELATFFGQLLGLIDDGDGVEGALPIPGPGLANLSYTQQELFQPIGWINQENGLPGIYPGRKPFGTNLGMMIDGYFFTLFAPDSGQGPGGFMFFDVSDPYNPTLVRRIYEPDARTSSLKEPHALGLARINGRRYMAFQSTIGIEFWDFTDINDLQKVGEIDLPGVNGGDYSNVAWQLSWQAPYLYVAGSEQGIYIVDTRDPATPVLADRGDKPNPVPVSELGGFRVGPIFAFGQQLVISSMENRDGFASLDISDPVNPKILDRIPDLDQFYYASCFNGEKLAVSVRGPSARMVLYDLTYPSLFELNADQLNVPGQLYCAFQDHYVFQGTEDRVHKIDLSDPLNPVDVGSGTMSGPLVRLVDHGQVSPLGNLVFVGNDHGTGSAFLPHSALPDLNAPKVLITSPRDLAEQVSVTTGIAISFTDVLDFNSITTDSVRILDEAGNTLAGSFSLQNGIVNFVPDQTLKPFTEYQIQVSEAGVTDVMGNKINQGFVSRFTTGSSNQLSVQLSLHETAIGPDFISDLSSFDVTLAESIPGATFQWFFGDGDSSDESTLTGAEHRYLEPGHYQVRLVIRWNGMTYQQSFIKTIVETLTDNGAQQSSTLTQSGDSVYVVNPDNGTVSSIDKQTQTVNWELPVGNAPQIITQDADGLLWVTVQDDDYLLQLNASGSVVNTVKLNYGDSPFAVVFNPIRNNLLVSLAGANELIQVDLAGTILSRLSLNDPRAIAISGDGSEAFVTRFISDDSAASVYRVQLNDSLQLLETIAISADSTSVDTQDRARGIANYLFDVAMSPSGNDIMVAAKKDNIFRGLFKDGEALAHDRTVRSIVNSIELATLDVAELDFDNRSGARAIAYSPLGDYLFVALQGSNNIAILDAYSGSQRVEIETPLAPQGLLIDGESGILYVHNFMDRSLSLYDVSGVLSSQNFAVTPLAEIKTVSLEKLSTDVLLGKQIFYNADDPRMSRESYLSCASCHVDGGHDGRTWDFTERGEGLRNTIALNGRSGLGHGNVHWTANFDEIQDFENDIRNGFGGIGFLTDEQFAVTADPLGPAKSGLSTDLDALATYVSSLDRVAKSPFKTDTGALTESALRGQRIFNSLDCGDCHSGSPYSDTQRHQLDTLVPGSGWGMSIPLLDLGIETPTLLGLWNTAPYFHHGQAKTLADVVRHPAHGNGQLLNEEGLKDLISYLNSLDGRKSSGEQPGAKLENGRWGCLGAESNQLLASVVLVDCAHAPTWHYDLQGRLSFQEQERLCLEHNGKPLAWSRVFLAECSDSRRQQFIFNDNQQLQLADAKHLVLAAFGGKADSKIGVWWRHKGKNQQWVLSY
ncbi:MAG: Ig-like domain-containing protein [Pseudomonadales bacterium]|nr:Ig-like domain-containing protein [Pseudomonadales bacterium]